MQWMVFDRMQVAEIRQAGRNGSTAGHMRLLITRPLSVHSQGRCGVVWLN
jgi:hypothetical protein